MLTILSVAYPLAPAGPHAIGGAEQVLAAIDEALVARGHRSIVIAAEGSRTYGTLVALPAPPPTIVDETWWSAHAACRSAIRDTLAREHVDVVHMHGADFHSYVPDAGPTMLGTLHLPVDWYPREIFAITRPSTYLNCVSQTQHRAAPASALLLAPIENGVDLDLFRPAAKHDDYVLVLGRICPEKAPHLAIDAAEAAGIPVVLAGHVFGFPEHQQYFREHIESRVRAPHRFVGSVSGAAKAALIASAHCVVVASQVAETSSLVTMEALACGTPVVAFRRGALVELVEDARTGYLVETVDELARAIVACTAIDRRACRAVAEARCSRTRMCEQYVERYGELAARSCRRVPRSVVEIVDRSGLEAFTGAWEDLWTQSRATIFQHPAWCLGWCRHLLQGSVEAIAIRRGSQLEALLPLFRWRDGNEDVLSFLGAGLSDYGNVLVASEATDLHRLASALEDRDWDRIELSEVPEDGEALRLHIAGAEQREPQDPCPGLTLGDVAFANVPERIRHEIEYQRRRAAREEGIETACVPSDQVIAELARLHRARWQLRGETGVLDDARCRFLEEVVAALSASGRVFATGVWLGGDLAATSLVFIDERAARFYLSGFDPTHARRSPGLLALAGAIEHVHGRGICEFDLLRGAEAYKYRLGARDRVRLWRRVVRRSTAGRMLLPAVA